jgi:undecaprenyl-diphosphatase
MELLNRLSHYDQRLFLWCAVLSHSASYSRYLQAFAKIISRSGDGYLQVVLPLGLLALYGETALALLTALLLAFSLERTLYWLLKNGLKRPRPPVAIPSFNALIIASDEFSFPSGHTSAAFLLAIITASFVPVLTLPLLSWASCIAVSRVILGVHFPADTIAGVALAALVASLVPAAVPL